MKRKLSQHFLFDKNILSKIVDSSGLQKGESVIEIGAGLGTLTEMMLPDAGRLCAFELDEKLISILHERFSRHMNLEIIHENFLKYDLLKLKRNDSEKFRIISNIPYAVTTDIITRLIFYRDIISGITITVQKEYGERLVGKPGTKAYSALTVFVNSYADPKILFSIPAGAFNPPPKVNSVVVRLDWNVKDEVTKLDTGKFSSFVKLLFSERRKMIRNSIKMLVPEGKDADTILRKAGINPEIRPETLNLNEFITLYRIANEE